MAGLPIRLTRLPVGLVGVNAVGLTVGTRGWGLRKTGDHDRLPGVLLVDHEALGRHVAHAAVALGGVAGDDAHHREDPAAREVVDDAGQTAQERVPHAQRPALFIDRDQAHGGGAECPTAQSSLDDEDADHVGQPDRQEEEGGTAAHVAITDVGADRVAAAGVGATESRVDRRRLLGDGEEERPVDDETQADVDDGGDVSLGDDGGGIGLDLVGAHKRSSWHDEPARARDTSGGAGRGRWGRALR